MKIAASAVFLTLAVAFQTDGKKQRGVMPVENSLEESRFIASFDLSPENKFDFIWPLESMRPSTERKVLVAVEKMPRVLRSRKTLTKAIELVLARDLRVNGRRERSLRGMGTPARFLVDLVAGRLRLSLAIPPGATLDPEHRVARIKLYQATSP